MKASILIFGLLLLLPAGTLAQQVPNPTGVATSNERKTANKPVSLPDPDYTPDALAMRMARLQRIEDLLYRAPTKAEMSVIGPGGDLVAAYSEFLREPHTGIVRLTINNGCDANHMVSASKLCLKYTMPGGGSSYSFRAARYRIGRLADLTFRANAFYAEGILTHGIMVGLGNVPLADVTLENAALKYLRDFTPSENLDQAKEVQKQLAAGVRSDGFAYGSAMTAVDNTTYALRVIAYHGKSLRAIGGVTFNELDFDKRDDVIVVFRIINRAADGSITILWKRLSKQDAPRLRVKRKAAV